MKFTNLLTITLIAAIMLAAGCGSEEPAAGTDAEGETTQTETDQPEEQTEAEPAATSETEQSTMDRLQGTWVGTVVGYDGEVKMTFAEGSADFQADLGGISYKGSVVINEDATPAQADYTIDECKFEQYIGKTSLGIFQFEDDTLVLAANEPGKTERPTEFQPMNGTQVFEFKRQMTSTQ
ncbi:Planctomycetes uncharacterized domain protein [Anaerohalosphaera lusitana]|uniref:Planctomycetes uncharacterized domain protein n=1 Tax=Anaerohalosphaera lusitana TaxID=1936003 RepID=A0A1U9NJK2_9BACT|nr:hypothetical protein [Anaerohalosphaera lusitana]AQT68113.1 Planctomycetes uncharacterized domain protein [Anaerohalosphaera lusitana]